MNRKVTASNKFICKAAPMSFPLAGNLSGKEGFRTSRNDRNKTSKSNITFELIRKRLQVNVKGESLFYLLLITFLVTLSSCSTDKDRIFKKSRIFMDTLVTITVVSGSEDNAENAIENAFQEIARLEKLTNFHSTDSEVTQINKSAGISRVKVSPDVLDVLNKALNVSENSGGAFDITIGPLISLYDFRKKIRPAESSIEKNIPLVNYKELSIDGNKTEVFLRKKGMLIDLGGIAKGYAADKAVEVLKKNGIGSGIVAVAGDIKTFGHKPDGSPWKIGIRHPRAKEGEDDIMATIELSDMAISTSGDYERFFFLEGIRYHHILSPKTGHPARECRSVTVITKEGASADAFATGIFVLGPEEGMQVLKKMGFEGIIVDREGNLHTTPGIRGKLEFKKSS
jgi:thiamine biosynthesis lipoprotein